MSANQPHKNDSAQGQPDDAPEAHSVPPAEQDVPLYDSFAEDLNEAPKAQGRDAASHHKTDEHIKTLEEEKAVLKDQLMRALADAENTRRRAQREREDASRFAISGFSKDLLSVADNLRRALDAMPAELVNSNPQLKNLTDGIEATERELLRTFEKNGIEKLDPIDQPFDPNFHEVMFETPIPGKAGGTVIQVIEAGYTLNGRILRPARVGIAKNVEGTQQDPSRPPGSAIDTQA